MNYNKLFKGLATSLCLTLILVTVISPTNLGIANIASADVSQGSSATNTGSLNVPVFPGLGSLTVQSANSSTILQVKQTVDVSKIFSSATQPNKTEIKVIPFYPAPSSLSTQSSAPRSAAMVPVNMTSMSSSTGPLVVNQYSGFEGSDSPASCFCTPPDGNIAVGPKYIFQMVNLEGKIWSKSGTLLETIPLSTFFGTGSLFISDPRVVYDNQSGHWFAIILATDFSHNGYVFTAASATTDPTGSWFIYEPQFANVIPDQPRLQVTDDKVTVVASDYPASGGWTGDEIFWLQKSTMINGSTTISFAHFGPDNTRFHIEPAVYPVAGNSDSWLVDDDNPLPGTTAEYLKASGPVTSISFVSTFTTPIGTIADPPGGRQPGTLQLVATNDDRILSASLRGTVFTWTANDACTPPHDSTKRSCVRWDAVDTSGTLLQDIDFGQVGKDLYYPAVSQNQPRSFGLIFQFSSPTEYPSIAFTGKSISEPFGTVDNPVLVKAGTGADTTGRHGDFAAVRADPSTGLYYGEAEYNVAGSPWNTFVTINGISTGTVVSHPTTLKLNTIKNVPWGTTVTIAGKLIDSITGIGIGGQPITFTSSAGLVSSSVTAADGTFSTTGKAPGAPTTTVNVSATYSGTQFFGASTSAVKSYSTIKHSTSMFQFAPTPNSLPWGRPITLMTTLYDTTLGGVSIVGKNITWSGTGVTGTPSAVTSSQGNAAATVSAKFTPGTWTTKSTFAGDSNYASSSSTSSTYTTLKHATAVTIWAPLNASRNSPVIFGATLIDLSAGGFPIKNMTLMFNGTGVVGGPIAGITNTDGDGVTHDTSPATVGTWTVTSSFAGNSIYSSSTSKTKSYTTS